MNVMDIAVRTCIIIVVALCVYGVSNIFDPLDDAAKSFCISKGHVNYTDSQNYGTFSTIKGSIHIECDNEFIYKNLEYEIIGDECISFDKWADCELRSEKELRLISNSFQP